MRKLALGLALACATGGLFVAWTAGTAIGARHEPHARRIAAERIEVPIKQTLLTDGVIRYSVPVKIGNASPIDAALDTGSTGLRVLRAAVPEQAYTASDQSSIFADASGDRLVGVIASAVVSIGQAVTDKPIPLEVVKSADCASRLPRCPTSRVSAPDFRIGGDGLSRQGFDAIVGVNMGNADAVNPLTQIGGHSWIVVLPRPGEARPGTLIVNPDSDDRTGYTLFPTDKILRGSPEGWHDSIAGCLASANPPKRICGPTVLDTGAVGIYIKSANAADLSGWKAGFVKEIAFKSESGAELSTTPFDAGTALHWRVSTTIVADQPRTSILAGSLPYFSFSVLYDAEHSVIGLKRR